MGVEPAEVGLARSRADPQAWERPRWPSPPLRRPL